MPTSARGFADLPAPWTAADDEVYTESADVDTASSQDRRQVEPTRPRS
jgi:hypothetical protein